MKTRVPQILKEIALGLKSIGQLKTYIEIGVHKGRTFSKVAPLAENAYAVDISDRYRRSFDFIPNCAFINMDSTKFFETFSDKADLIFIDGLHTYQKSLSDTMHAIRIVNENGIIVLHDTCPENERWITKDGIRGCGEAFKTALNLKKSYLPELEVATLPFYHGITIIRKININLQMIWM